MRVQDFFFKDESVRANICSFLVVYVVTIYLYICIYHRKKVMRVQAASYDHKPALLGVSLSYKLSSSFCIFRSLIMILSIILLLIPIINGVPLNSYYLIDIDQNISLNTSYCSNILTNDHTYRIPKQCHRHLLCNPYYCDDQSFRCIKIRESLCCLNQYFQSNCEYNNSNRIKDLFRSIYFQISIEHGYCEINLERIEKHDQAYCIANIDESIETTTTMISTSIRSFIKYFHRRSSTVQPNRYHHRLAIRQNYSALANLDYLQRVTIIEANISSKSSRIFRNSLLIISFLFSILN